MQHPFFDELRDPATRLPNGRAMPPLFNWQPEELVYLSPEVQARISQGTAADGGSGSTSAPKPE